MICSFFELKSKIAKNIGKFVAPETGTVDATVSVSKFCGLKENRAFLFERLSVFLQLSQKSAKKVALFPMKRIDN